MPTSLKDVIENTKTLYMTDSALNSLLDFERVIDELDIYTFDHWKQGELVAGPKYEKYFVTCTVRPENVLSLLISGSLFGSGAGVLPTAIRSPR